MTLAVAPAIIRAAENPMIASAPADHLMRQAARQLASAIRTVAQKHHCNQIVIAAGGGGNGGDGLYAGVYLAESGYNVAVVSWHPAGKLYAPAARAARQAGCPVYSREANASAASKLNAFILVDAIQGLGSKPLNRQDAIAWDQLVRSSLAVVAVDIPTGVCANTGAAPPEHILDNGQRIAAHVNADFTVTFGALRTAHATSLACGETAIADIYGVAGESLQDAVAAAQRSQGSNTAAVDCFAAVTHTLWEQPLQPLTQHTLHSFAPRPYDHKYSGGVVGVVAGSNKYPGAGVLSTLAAVKTTPSLVRYFGDCAADVVRAIPEVIASVSTDPESLTQADNRVSAWVFGPGTGVTADSAAVLKALLRSKRPLLIDADGITLLAGSAELQQLLRERDAVTLLTPHDGEFQRLSAALPAAGIDLVTDRAAAVRSLAKQLGVTVLLKGRKTLVCSPQGLLSSIDAGHSWAATAGSGDVLAGLLGALLAHDSGADPRNTVATPAPLAAYPQSVVAAGVSVHAKAAWIAAQTPFGPGPVTASQIAQSIPAAVASLSAQSTASNSQP